MLGNFLAARKAVLDVKPDGVFDVFNRLFVCVPLAVAALEGRTRNVISVRVGFDKDGKRNVFHSLIIGSDRPPANWNPRIGHFHLLLQSRFQVLYEGDGLAREGARQNF